VSVILIFVIGLIVTAIAMTGVVLIGLQEAAQPTLSRREDLTEWEWKRVKDERPES